MTSHRSATADRQHVQAVQQEIAPRILKTFTRRAALFQQQDSTCMTDTDGESDE